MFCPKCGKKVDESDAFCRSCAHTLSTEKPASTGVAPASIADETVGVGKAGEPTRKSGEATAIIRVVVLLFALGFIISERDWIRDAADEMGGYDAALKTIMADTVKLNQELLKDAQQASTDALINGPGLTNKRETDKPVDAGKSPSAHTGISDGTAEVYSWPTSATVWLDSEEIGETPLTVPLNAGSHQIRIAKDGYSTWQSQIAVRSGQTEHVEVTLTSVAPAGVTESRRRGAGGEKSAEPTAEPKEAVQARGYKDEEGMYRVRRADDGEAQYQFNAINEDLITLVPDCATADPGMKREIDKSLKLDEYQLSNLMGRDEAKAFHKRVVEQGCF